MANAIFGRKLGMTQVFSAGGEARGVSVVQAGPCIVVQVKTQERDGYDAIQLGFGTTRRTNDPQKGHMKQLGQFRYLREVRVDDPNAYQIGQALGADLFEEGDIVDVIGTSKGKGFAGGVKRHHFHGGPKTHGQSDKGRSPGSIGSGTTPGRVRKGLRMAGHMGDEQVTVKNLRVFDIDADRNVLLIEGAVPGASNAILRIRKTGRVSNQAKLVRPVAPVVEEEEPVAAEEPVAEAEEEAPEAVAEEPAADSEAETAEAPAAEAEEKPE
jgi:large subunit ribosomal protein L3